MAAVSLEVAPGGYAAIVRRSAHRWPGRTALRFGERSWTYREFDAWVDAVAGGLAELGVRGRVVVLSGNRPEVLVAQFALARLGAAFATPNPAWTEAELRPALDAAAATALIGESRFATLAERCSGVFVDIDALPHWPRLTEQPDDPLREAYLPFSSGTTGAPKAVLHSSRSLVGGVAQLVDSLRLTDRDRLQLSLPLCHIFGTTLCGAAFAVGAELTLFERFDLDASLDHLRSTGVTVFPLAGTTAHRLAQRPDLGALPSLRFFMWGGGPAPAALAADITARTGVPFLCSYGMTEVMMVAFNRVDRPEDWRLDSPGFATAGTAIRVSAIGELQVRGPSLAIGYAGHSSGGPWDDGWFSTGDLGRLDTDGRVHIVGRLKDMLKVSGFAVSPVEVEQALMELDGVDDCAVFGRPDERLGEVLVALVVGRTTEDALRAWASTRLATYKQPREYRFVQELPRSPAGKLLRRELKGPTDD